NGLFPSVRTPGKQRLYCIKQYLDNQQYHEPEQKPATPRNICYCRASSNSQKDELCKQVHYMQERFPGCQVIIDIGSGLNFSRKGLQTILELSSKGLLTGGTVVVSFRDRITRLAFELVERILQLHGVKLLVLNQEMEGSEHGELVEDLLAIINVFNCRINGRRKYLTKERRESKE
ncbi:hypothetical protein DUNSADRAFT_9067, partial [Dunaliella salina]